MIEILGIPPISLDIPHTAFNIVVDGKSVFQVGLDEFSSIVPTYYLFAKVDIDALKSLPISSWKELRRRFANPAFTILANIPVENEVSRKFAEFFGFKYLRVVRGLAIYVRK